MLAEELPTWFVRMTAFLFGSLWGSFFNVAIYRWPRAMSVISPPSHCPACGAPVPWYRNVPILAYVVQRGRAACCGAKMTPRYMLVEVLAGVLCVALAERFFIHAPGGTAAGAATAEVALYFAFVGALIVATFTDLEWMMIPDEVSLPGAALGLVSVMWRDVEAMDMAIGAGAGFLIVQLVFVWSYERLMGRRGMGEGDAKLLLMIGAFVGWRGVLFSIAAGSLQGVLAVIVGYLSGRKLVTPPQDAGEDVDNNDFGPRDARCADVEGEASALAESGADEDHTDEESGEESDEDADAEDSGDDSDTQEDGISSPLKMPFGPLLALGALEWLFFGERILEWYLGFFR
ncbi:MAG: prepilin peptidase, partial [Myxococcota bacterium]